MTDSSTRTVTNGTLTLVDLSGSENIKRSGSKDARQREASHINAVRTMRRFLRSSTHIGVIGSFCAWKGDQSYC